jgi:D-3-phosphoglycerate dehydrogenase
MNCFGSVIFITIHLPKKDQRDCDLIGADALRKVKPSVRIINAARGGVLDKGRSLYRPR